MVDERAFSRYPVPEAAEVHATVAFDGQAYYGRVTDLSLHGLFVTLQADIPQDAEVEVTLRTGGQHAGIPLTCHGRAVWISRDGVGIEIRYMDSRTFTQYRNLVAAICRDPDELHSQLRAYVNPPS